MASTKLTRTIGTPTLNTKYTISFWIKKGSIGNIFVIDGRDDASNRFKIAFGTTGTIECFNYHSGSPTIEFTTNRVFRDPSAFYHMLLAVDTTDGTAGDRFKFYVNGVRETSFNSSTNPSSSEANNVINESGNTVTIGAYNSGSGNNYYFDGSLSHFHFIDGQAYAPTVFGETDSVSSIWKPKTAPSVTYGNNGFFLKFENSGAMGTDSSGNSNTFTVSGTLTQNVDTPSNNFATLNPLIYSTGNNTTLSNGNTTVTSSGASHKNAFSSLGVSSGKWYCEIEVDTLNTHQKIGVASDDNVEINKTSPSEFSGNANGYAYRNDGQKEGGGGSISSYGNTYTNGDIIGIAMDLDNNKLYFSKNGTWQNSGDPESGATGTGSAFTLSSDKTYFIAINHYNSNVSDFNFGQGYFGTTAVASAGTAPSEGGIFEYDCPSGYQALCTKGINSF